MPEFFADFAAGSVLLVFVGESVSKKPSRKSLAKSSKFYTTKVPDAFLQRGRAKNCFGIIVLGDLISVI